MSAGGTNIFWMIVGVSLATLLPRMLPVALFSGLDFPPKLKLWLSFVAPAVLGGLTLLSILAPRGALEITPGNIFIWAFVPTFLVALKTRSLFYTMIAGMAVAALLRYFFGL